VGPNNALNLARSGWVQIIFASYPCSFGLC